MTNDKYKLVQLTDNKEIEYCHSINFVEWSNGLTRDQYLLREKGVKLKLSRDGMNLTYWALKEKQDSGEWKIVSAFESVSRPALYKKKGSPVDHTVSHSIGSVFTAKQFRGQGYAREMMARAVEQLAHHDCGHLNKEQQKEVLVALWSDIKDYYAQFGYKLVDTHELKVTVDENAPRYEWPHEVRPLSSEEIASMARESERQLIHDMDIKTERDGITRVAIAPRPAVFAHTHWRSEYVGPLLTKGPERGVPTVFGAQTGRTSVIWTQDYGNNKLYFLKTIVSSPNDQQPVSADQITADLNLILQAALNEVQKWGIKYICLWTQDVPEMTALSKVYEAFMSEIHPGISAVVHERMDSWPMFSVPGDPEPVEWVSNGKYAWF